MCLPYLNMSKNGSCLLILLSIRAIINLAKKKKKENRILVTPAPILMPQKIAFEIFCQFCYMSF